MIISGRKRGGGERETEEHMERLKRLHNFDLPYLRWGNQKVLRCMKVDSNGELSVVDRNHSAESYGAGSGGGGALYGTRRRESEFGKRFRIRSSDDDDDDDDDSKLLRCMKVDSIGYRNQSPESYGGGGAVVGTRRRDSEFETRSRIRSSDYDRKTENSFKFSSSEKVKSRIGVTGVTGDGEIEAAREKLLFDFQNEVYKMKEKIHRENLMDPPPNTAATTSNSPSERPWNLRTRRAACKDPRSPSNAVNGDVLKPNFSPLTNECKNPNLQLKNGTVNAITSGDETVRPKFSVSISRREVEEDFMKLTGRRLPRKPKKRPRVVQKQLDTLFPGLWLTEVTADRYKVPDEAETRKR